MKYTPPLPSEKDLRARFASIGIGPDGSFNAATLTPEMRTAIEGGMADAWAELATLQKDKIDTGQVTSGDLFGTREYLRNNYLYRMAGAVLGIYGMAPATVGTTAAPNPRSWSSRWSGCREPPDNTGSDDGALRGHWWSVRGAAVQARWARRRMPLSPTMTVDPSCPATPSGRGR
jgi:hypothetical protein